MNESIDKTEEYDDRLAENEVDMRFEFVEGTFDMDTDKLVCVSKDKYKDVHLCFKSNMNIAFAEIKLYDSERFVDKEATFESAVKLGEEIARRWNLQSESTGLPRPSEQNPPTSKPVSLLE